MRRLGEDDGLTRACWGGLGRRLQFRDELGMDTSPASSSGILSTGSRGEGERRVREEEHRGERQRNRREAAWPCGRGRPRPRGSTASSASTAERDGSRAPPSWRCRDVWGVRRGERGWREWCGLLWRARGGFYSRSGGSRWTGSGERARVRESAP